MPTHVGGVRGFGAWSVCARGTIGQIGLVRFHVVAHEPDLCGWLVLRSSVKKALSRFQTNFFLSAHSLGFFFCQGPVVVLIRIF